MNSENDLNLISLSFINLENTLWRSANIIGIGLVRPFSIGHRIPRELKTQLGPLISSSIMSISIPNT